MRLFLSRFQALLCCYHPLHVIHTEFYGPTTLPAFTRWLLTRRPYELLKFKLEVTPISEELKRAPSVGLGVLCMFVVPVVNRPEVIVGF